MVKKRALNIQIHPNRISNLRVDKMILLFSELANESKYISDCRIHTDTKDKYINIAYLTSNAKIVWKEIRTKILNKKGRHSSSLKNASIIVCEGTRSWEDYLLLHHFDKNQKIDHIKKSEKE